MKNGYKIFWTAHALFELKETIHYLETHWETSDLINFAGKLEHTIELISKNPYLFPTSVSKQEVRKAVVTKHNTLYYRIINQTVEITSLFSNMQHPDKRKI